MSEPYSRLYHRFPREFRAVYDDDRTLAAWVRLLLLADASWPMRPPLPRSVKARTLANLVGAGLVTVEGETYAIRGLDAERNRRSEAGRTGAAVRWHSDTTADAMPRRERDETSRDEIDTPPPPAERGRRSDGTNLRSTGGSPRQNGTSPRDGGTSPRQIRQKSKRDRVGDPTVALLQRAAEAGREP